MGLERKSEALIVWYASNSVLATAFDTMYKGWAPSYKCERETHDL